MLGFFKKGLPIRMRSFNPLSRFPSLFKPSNVHYNQGNNEHFHYTIIMYYTKHKLFPIQSKKRSLKPVNIGHKINRKFSFNLQKQIKPTR